MGELCRRFHRQSVRVEGARRGDATAVATVALERPGAQRRRRRSRSPRRRRRPRPRPRRRRVVGGRAERAGPPPFGFARGARGARAPLGHAADAGPRHRARWRRRAAPDDAVLAARRGRDEQARRAGCNRGGRSRHRGGGCCFGGGGGGGDGGGGAGGVGSNGREASHRHHRRRRSGLAAALVGSLRARPAREAVFSFLRNANPAAYGGPDTRATDVQEAALEDAANGAALMRAAQSPTGEMPASDCPIHWAAEDSRNVWALEGRLARRRARSNCLSLASPRRCSSMAAEERRAGRRGGAGGGPLDRDGVLGGAVVLADLLCQPSSVLLSHSPTLARSPSAYAEWRWADKSVLELGCGISVEPALVASLQGARRVVATDANDAVLRDAREREAVARRPPERHPALRRAAALGRGRGRPRAAGGVGRGDHLRRHPGGRLRVRAGKPRRVGARDDRRAVHAHDARLRHVHGPRPQKMWERFEARACRSSSTSCPSRDAATRFARARVSSRTPPARPLRTLKE